MRLGNRQRRYRADQTMFLVWLVFLLGACAIYMEAGEAAASIEDLAWIAGNWEGTSDRMGPAVRVEERWTPIAGGAMLGVNRSLAEGKMVFFEFLRIESRPDGIYYVAHPKGRAGTDFKLLHIEKQRVVFENLAHDYPQRIIYAKKPDGALLARVEGEQNGKLVSEEFLYRPMKKD